MAARKPPPKKHSPSTITITHDGWEADCRGGTVQDLLDISSQNEDDVVSGYALIKAALAFVEVVRDPDGKEQEIGAAPAGLFHTLVAQHPFFRDGI